MSQKLSKWILENASVWNYQAFEWDDLSDRVHRIEWTKGTTQFAIQGNGSGGHYKVCVYDPRIADVLQGRILPVVVTDHRGGRIRFNEYAVYWLPLELTLSHSTALRIEREFEELMKQLV
jgi:hypothetical protein